jgi:pyridinium-3,5-biscarboxylic acid mononucleotide sulfurtransferase
MSIQKKYQKLLQIIKQYKKPLVALSGGCDSCLLTYAVAEAINKKALAVTIKSPLFAKEEIERAVAIAKKTKMQHLIIDVSEKHIKLVKNNPVNRCYLCKKEIFKKISEIAAENKCDIVFDGSNLDDLKEYRPGRKAIEELKVLSPLKEAGFTKQEIRDLSQGLKLESANYASFACYATRFVYGDTITIEKLTAIDNSERYLKEMGFTSVRVRTHGNIARIEVAPCERSKFYNDKKLDNISNKLKSFGFTYVTFELAGYKTGSMDVDVDKK